MEPDIISKPGERIRWVIVTFIILALSVVIINDLGSRFQQGATANVAGEGRWTKAQKQAVISLVKYTITEQEGYYESFMSSLKEIEGGRIAREELIADGTDYEVVHNGFLQSNTQPDEISSLIWTYRYFSNFEPIQHAIQYWVEADSLIDELLSVGNEIKHKIDQGALTQEESEEYISRIYSLDAELSVIETGFSQLMSDTAKWMSFYVYWATLLILFLLILIAAYITVSQMRGMKKLNTMLVEKDRQFRHVLENSRDIIYKMNIKDDTYEYVSPSVERILGYSTENFLKEGMDFTMKHVHPEDLERIRKERGNLKSDNEVVNHYMKSNEFRIRKADGEYIWVSNIRTLIKDENDKPVAVVGNVRDITERKNLTDALSRSLQEKEMLLSEVHHRVKNNLSIVSSLIEIHASGDDAVDGNGYAEIQSRIKSIALLHEKLYQTNTFSDIDLAEYLHDLVRMVSGTFNLPRCKVKFIEELDSVITDFKTATSLGLLCNELINNCYKHAFGGLEKGEIHVVLKFLSDSDEVLFSVSDNGNGLPDEFDQHGKNSLGMILIKALAMQLNGELNFSSGEGTTFSVRFNTRQR